MRILGKACGSDQCRRVVVYEEEMLVRLGSGAGKERGMQVR